MRTISSIPDIYLKILRLGKPASGKSVNLLMLTAASLCAFPAPEKPALSPAPEDWPGLLDKGEWEGRLAVIATTTIRLAEFSNFHDKQLRTRAAIRDIFQPNNPIIAFTIITGLQIGIA